MSTLKLNSFFVDIKRNFRVDLKNVDLNNYTLVFQGSKLKQIIVYCHLDQCFSTGGPPICLKV